MLAITASHYTEAEINRAEAMIQGLIFACPFNDSWDSCPFNSLRKGPIEERFAKTLKLEAAETLALYQAHSDCLRVREMKIK